MLCFLVWTSLFFRTSEPFSTSVASPHKQRSVMSRSTATFEVTPTQALDFFILIEKDFGSRSPAMHNAAFRKLNLPHVYSVLELPKDGGLDDTSSQAAAALRARFMADSFGGASVTIPHKQLVIPFLDELTPAATRIGAVNTVIPQTTPSGRRLLGDNTDWLGVCIAIEAALARRSSPPSSHRALLIGSGGTARAAAYALTDGTAARGGQAYELFVHARDLTKAADLATAFGGSALELHGDDFNRIVGDQGFAVIVSTIPGDSNFELPPEVLASRPAVLDAAYKPAKTALLLQAAQAGSPVAQGATMLFEQGVAQLEIWTSLPAPREVMKAAVFEGIPNLEQRAV